MKYALAFFMLLLLSEGFGQTIPVFPASPDATTKQKKAIVVKKTETAAKTEIERKPDSVIVKYVSDVDAVLYIDGENKGDLKKDIPLSVKLARGEYSLKAVSTANEKDFKKWVDKIIETGMQKVEEIEMQVIINQRINAETMAATASVQDVIDTTVEQIHIGENEKKLEFLDDFTDNKNKWSLTSDEFKKIDITSGKFVIHGISPSKTYQCSRTFNIDLQKSFSCAVTTKWIEGTPGNHDKGFGITYCSDFSAKSFNTFLISSAGMYQIAFIENKGTWKYTRQWTACPYINKGGMPNLLLIKKENGNISFFINHHMVASVPFDGGFGNAMGFWVEEQQTVEFDNLEIRGVKKI